MTAVSILSPGGYPRPRYGSFSGKLPSVLRFNPGWARGSRRLGKKELDQRLKSQREETFSRTTFDELKRAELAGAAKADKTKNKKQKAALNLAADVATEVQKHPQLFDNAEVAKLASVLSAAASATKFSEAIKQAHLASVIAANMAERIRQDDEDDEETAIMLLLS